MFGVFPFGQPCFGDALYVPAPAPPSVLSWPVSLPLPRIGVGSRWSLAVDMSLMDTGRFRSRQVVPAPQRVLSVEWAFTQGQLDTFQTFFEDTLENGTLTFEIEIYGIVEERVFADSKYQLAHEDGAAIVSADLELIT